MKTSNILSVSTFSLFQFEKKMHETNSNGRFENDDNNNNNSVDADDIESIPDDINNSVDADDIESIPDDIDDPSLVKIYGGKITLNITPFNIFRVNYEITDKINNNNK
ncbi:hypothetical protein RCL_jg13847.t1 [Rhizophagus clarus]|uniref:Uncharacterized protein n=1 Tax=Rhizophagus clarus TaxID=94130 RepID=A0A8H3LSV0_9GLOM|nr:hypothetical protein RCL_jg13847.t1 [Rhizophagus clarus]